MICDHCEEEKPTASLPYKPFKTKYSSCGNIDLCEECLRKMLAQLTKRAPDVCPECEGTGDNPAGDSVSTDCPACGGTGKRG